MRIAPIASAAPTKADTTDSLLTSLRIAEDDLALRLRRPGEEEMAAHTGKGLPVDSDIDGALKPYLKAYFFGTCAYCESQLDHVAYGDVEHHRPKRLVEECAGHPGYYWLAYAEENLLPSCQLCNQGKGKRNRFPIQGVYAMSPDADLEAEKPLLLNPYHLAHSPGTVKPFSLLEPGLPISVT